MKPKRSRKVVALEHIRELFDQAQLRVKTDPLLSNRYVFLARKIAMKIRIHIPGELKRRFCKHCYAYLAPGITSRVRVARVRVMITCLSCQKTMRIPYSKEKIAKKKLKVQR